MKKQIFFTRWSLKLALGAVLIAVLAVISYRFALVDFQPALLGLVAGAIIGLLAILMGLVGTIMAIKAKKPEITATLAGPTLGFLLVMPVLLAALAGASVPRIHDITTDLLNPPQFSVIEGLRTSVHNPLDRKVPEDLAALQKVGYPNLGPIRINRPVNQVFKEAVLLVEKRGWEVVSVAAEEGRIEATDTTRIMGFKDDVVIRLQAQAGQTQVDMRSVSRVGQSDLGVNAARIKRFLADLGGR
jgi:uncharacterized protein DUF1499